MATLIITEKTSQAKDLAAALGRAGFPSLPPVSRPARLTQGPLPQVQTHAPPKPPR
jgi:hypothetical protein